jgi:hypothetical protein
MDPNGVGSVNILLLYKRVKMLSKSSYDSFACSKSTQRFGLIILLIINIFDLFFKGCI